MGTSVQKITLAGSRDVPFNKLLLSQSNVRRVKAGVSIEELAEDIARRRLLQGLSVRGGIPPRRRGRVGEPSPSALGPSRKRRALLRPGA